MYWTKKTERWSQLKVALVVSSGLAVLILTVFFAGTIEDIFSPKTLLNAKVVDVKGLRKGSPVWLSGIEVGSVKDITLNGSEGALISMTIDKTIMKHLKKDSQISILTMGLLGDKYIELGYGTKEAAAVQPGDVLYGRTQTDFKDVMQTGTEAIQKIGGFVDRLGSLIEKIEHSQGTLARFVRDPSLYDSLKETSINLKNITSRLNSNEGALGLLINDPSLYNSLNSSAEAVNRFALRLNSSEGSLNRLIDDATLYNNLSQGAERFSAVSERLSLLISSIEKEGGTIQMLMKDRELAQDLRDVVAELKNLTKDIRENPKRYLKFSIF